MALVGFQLEFFVLTVLQRTETETAKKTRYQGSLSFHFWKVNDRSCHSEVEQKATYVQGYKSTFYVQRTQSSSLKWWLWFYVGIQWPSIAITFILY